MFFFVFFFTFSLYLHNLSRSVFGGDAGDFIHAAMDGSLAHPPGYPLYVLLGSLFNFLPIVSTPAWKVGVLSVIVSTFSVTVVYVLVTRIFNSKMLGVITACTLAFVYPFWLYAEVVEAFSLHYLFVVLILCFSIFYILKDRTIYLYFLALLIGLSLAHHQSILLVFPAVLFALCSHGISRLFRPRMITLSLLLIVLGLSFYFYLPFGSDRDTLLIWERVDSVSSFINFVSRRNYGWGLQATTGWAVRLLGVESYATYWLHQLPPVFIIASFLGVWKLWRINRKILIFLLLGFFFTGPLFIVYSATPLFNEFLLGVLERFYVLSFIFFLIFFPYGIVYISEIIMNFLNKVSIGTSAKILLKNLIYPTFLIVPLFLFSFNISRTNLKNVWIGDYFAYDILQPLPNDTLLFLSSDSTAFNVAYIQRAFREREDVLRTSQRSVKDYIYVRPTYLEYMEKYKLLHPGLREQDYPLVTLFALEKRPIIAEYALGEELGEDAPVWDPYGLLVRKRENKASIMNKNDFLKLQEKLFATYHISAMRDAVNAENTPLTLQEIPQRYAEAYTRVGEHLLRQYGDPEAAKVYYNKALEVVPDHKLALRRLVELSRKK